MSPISQEKIAYTPSTGRQAESTILVNKRVTEYILNLTAGNFTGKVRLTFENGKVVHIVNEKTIKP